MSEDIPLAALIFATVVPFLRAMAPKLSPLLTVYEPPFRELLLPDFLPPDLDEVFFLVELREDEPPWEERQEE